MYKKMFQVSLVIALVALANFIKFLVSKDSGGAYEGPISIVLMFFPPLVAGMLYSMDDNEKRYIRAKDIYFSLLDKLESDPDNTKLRIEVLEAGRVFYSKESPDYIVSQGSSVWLDDHSAGREARIQSDINARIGGARKSA